MKPTQPLMLVAAGAALLAAACGNDDEPTASDPATGAADRTVEIRMVDIEFEPAQLDVRASETIRFVFDNSGEVVHDAFIGDSVEQADHEDEMREAEDMDMDHGAQDEDAVTVEPGEQGELVFTFDEAGEIEIGCHQPGHYDSGMKAAVTVS